MKTTQKAKRVKKPRRHDRYVFDGKVYSYQEGLGTDSVRLWYSGKGGEAYICSDAFFMKNFAPVVVDKNEVLKMHEVGNYISILQTFGEEAFNLVLDGRGLKEPGNIVDIFKALIDFAKPCDMQEALNSNSIEPIMKNWYWCKRRAHDEVEIAGERYSTKEIWEQSKPLNAEALKIREAMAKALQSLL